MTYRTEIEQRLTKAFRPSFLKVINESEKHRGHGNGPQVPGMAQTHFAIKMVSERFDALPRLDRHRLVYEVLEGLLPEPIHALRLQLFGIDEEVF